jgi:hypothetical protein
MVKSRRRLFVTSWATLSAQVLVLALGTAQVCVEREHTHGGIAAPDCPTHHQSARASDVSEHAYHSHSTASDVQPSDEQITCRCSSDLSLMYLGQVGVLDFAGAPSSFVEGALLDPPSATSTADRYFSPPSPPPR